MKLFSSHEIMLLMYILNMIFKPHGYHRNTNRIYRQRYWYIFQEFGHTLAPWYSLTIVHSVGISVATEPIIFDGFSYDLLQIPHFHTPVLGQGWIYQRLNNTHEAHTYRTPFPVLLAFQKEDLLVFSTNSSDCGVMPQAKRDVTWHEMIIVDVP